MYDKKQQLYKEKKAKPSMKNKPKITQHERDYLEWLQLQNHNCILCDTKNNIEMHHVKYKSTDKKNHKRLIPLCAEHHTGKIMSPHGTPVKWRRHVPLELQNKIADEIYKEYLDEKA